jgi:hypothetical protein
MIPGEHLSHHPTLYLQDHRQQIHGNLQLEQLHHHNNLQVTLGELFIEIIF